MTDTTTEDTEEQPNDNLPLREAMPDEVDGRALRLWIQDFLYNPPETDRDYKDINWVDNEE